MMGLVSAEGTNQLLGSGVGGQVILAMELITMTDVFQESFSHQAKNKPKDMRHHMVNRQFFLEKLLCEEVKYNRHCDNNIFCKITVTEKPVK